MYFIFSSNLFLVLFYKGILHVKLGCNNYKEKKGTCIAIFGGQRDDRRGVTWDWVSFWKLSMSENIFILFSCLLNSLPRYRTQGQSTSPSGFWSDCFIYLLTSVFMYLCIHLFISSATLKKSKGSLILSLDMSLVFFLAFFLSFLVILPSCLSHSLLSCNKADIVISILLMRKPHFKDVIKHSHWMNEKGYQPVQCQYD